MIFIGLYGLIMPLVTPAAVNSFLREELIAAYIFNLARNITWPDRQELKNFHIRVIENEPRVGPALKRLVKGLDIKGLPVTVSSSDDPLELPPDVQLVYLGREMKRFNSALIARTRGRPILVISFDARDYPPILIDLYEDSARRIHFRVNPDLLKKRKLLIDPDLILLGGNEIAINKLFKSTLKRLREQQEQLQKQRQRLKNQQQKLQIQKQRIEANRLTLERMKQGISRKRKELEQKRGQIKQLKRQSGDSRRQLEALKSILGEKTSELESLKNELQETRQQARDLQRQSERYADALREQREAIQARNKVLSDQQKKIDRLDRTIQYQMKKISGQARVLESQADLLRQRTTILILSIGLTILAVIFMVFFLWQRRRYQRLSRELSRAYRATRTASQAKSIFLANMSHELRTPLNAILGFSDILLKAGELDPERKKYLGIVNRSGRFLLTLINDVLNLSRVEAGKMTLEPQTVELHSLVREVVDLVRDQARDKDLALEMIWQGKEDPIIRIDAGKLKQILLNLLSNALKYTDRGGITLRIDVTEGWLNIEVEDTGRGISPADREKIFEPFVQTGSASSNTGTGLGLSIVRQYAQLMGGDVTVESEVGKGSTFRLGLPYEAGLKDELAKESASDTEKIIGLAAGQEKYRILIVDDQEEARLLLRKLIEDLGLSAREAENGLEAIRIFERWHPHLIWMDQRMPVMNGDEATRRIRELPGGKEVRIIALTASFHPEQQQQLLDAGMDAVVPKPAHSREIHAAMERFLGLQYLRQTSREHADETVENVSHDHLRARLAKLDTELVDELYATTLLLNGDEVAQVLQRIEPRDAELTKMLNRMVENMQYGELLKVIRDLPDRSS